MPPRQGQRSNMAAAAAVRTAPDAAPAGQTAIRTTPVRITVDLQPAAYTALNHWIETAAAAVDPDAVPFHRISQSAAVRAMIEAAVTDDIVSSVVTGLLRKDTGQ